MSDQPPVDIYVEEGKLSDDLEKSLSEEQTYRETMGGIRSYMGWTHIPDIDSSAATSDDSPFAGPKLYTPGKVSVQLSTHDCLCRKLSKLNLTLVEGYPLCSSEVGGLLKDQFVLPAKSQAKWYRLYSDQKGDSTAGSSWNTDSSRLNSTYSRLPKRLESPQTMSYLSVKSRQVGEVIKGSFSDL